MHSSYQEDVETQGTDLPVTPAFWFVTLDSEKADQFFHEYVKYLMGYLDQILQKYRITGMRQLQLSEFQDLFLRQPPSKHVVFSFTYNLASKYLSSVEHRQAVEKVVKRIVQVSRVNKLFFEGRF
jgi:hypothetical protein